MKNMASLFGFSVFFSVAGIILSRAKARQGCIYTAKTYKNQQKKN